jgi:hypothetical protein
VAYPAIYLTWPSGCTGSSQPLVCCRAAVGQRTTCLLATESAGGAQVCTPPSLTYCFGRVTARPYAGRTTPRPSRSRRAECQSELVHQFISWPRVAAKKEPSCRQAQYRLGKSAIGGVSGSFVQSAICCTLSSQTKCRQSIWVRRKLNLYEALRSGVGSAAAHGDNRDGGRGATHEWTRGNEGGGCSARHDQMCLIYRLNAGADLAGARGVRA